MGKYSHEGWVEFFGEHPNFDNQSIDWKTYCAKKLDQPDCDECALANYGRDCHNNKFWRISEVPE